MTRLHRTAKVDPAATNSLPDQVAAWQDKLAAIGLLEPGQSRALDAAIGEARAGRVDNPPPPLLTVLLLGATGGGKSALLNALAGAEIARSHHLRPTTSQPTIYMHESLSPARLFEYGPELGELAKSGGSIQTHSREDLRLKVIIDAPDIDSYRTEHRDSVMRLLPVVDVVLYVVTPFSYKDDIGWTVILRERGRRAVAFVMNKWDAEGLPRTAPGEPGADEDFEKLVRGMAGYDNPRIFKTSARYWAADAAARAEMTPPAAGENFSELKAWLEQGLSTSRIEQIQRRRRRSLWAALTGAVDSALPAELDTEAVRRAVVAETDMMATEGAATWAPLVEMRAEAMARRREEEGRPHSPGPFGRLSGLLGAVINAGQSWRKVAEPRPDATPAEVAAAAGRSAELATRKLSRLEWTLREMKVPTTAFEAQNAALASDLEERLRASFQSQSEQILGRVIQRWRITAGWIVLTIFELLTVGLLGLAAWRLIQAFVSASYLDLTFTLNLFALVVLLLTAGSAIMALLFPPVKTRIRRELTLALADQWRAAADRAMVGADEYLERLVGLRDEGMTLLEQCNGRVAEITREMNAVEDGETERLFSAHGTT